jgi:hypothetical protein
MRTATPEQKAKAAARREKFRGLAKQISAMSDAARAELAAKLPGLVTVEGRALSAGNMCLVAVQKPDATMVGGFRQWLKAGRCVAKGSVGLMIWVPTGKRDSDAPAASAAADKETGGEAGERPGFIMGTVFDVSQTVELTADGEQAPAGNQQLEMLCA